MPTLFSFGCPLRQFCFLLYIFVPSKVTGSSEQVIHQGTGNAQLYGRNTSREHCFLRSQNALASFDDWKEKHKHIATSELNERYEKFKNRVLACGDESRTPPNDGGTHNSDHSSEPSRPVPREIETFTGHLEDEGTLERALDHMGTNGRVVLLTVGGDHFPTVVTHLTNALGLVHRLREFGREGALLLTTDPKACEYVAKQKIVPVQACVWTTFLNSSRDWWPKMDESRNGYKRAMNARLLVYGKLLEMKRTVHVLFVDNDVCFFKDPFPTLEATQKSLLMSGHTSQFNLGVMFGRNDLEGLPDDLGLITEVNRRLAYIRALNDTRLSGRQYNAMWDQFVVNDVYEQWLTGNQTYTRSCLAFQGDERCILPECCQSEPIKVVHNGTGRLIMNANVIGMGTSKELIAHRNIQNLGVERNDENGKPINHISWLQRTNCWYPPLNALIDKPSIV